jgi:hypothetical protein
MKIEDTEDSLKINPIVPINVSVAFTPQHGTSRTVQAATLTIGKPLPNVACSVVETA